MSRHDITVKIDPGTPVPHPPNIHPNNKKENDSDSDYDTSDPVGLKEEKLPRFLAFLSRFHGWPFIMRTFIYIVLGCGVLLIPGILDYLLRPNVPEANLSILDGNFKSSIPGFPLILWSLWVACGWAVYFGSSWLWVAFPALSMFLLTPVLGRRFISDAVRPRLEYVQHLHHYLALVVLVIVQYVLASKIFNFTPGKISDDYSQKDLWKLNFDRVLQCALIGVIFLALEKWALQSVAVNFHQTAYTERIVRAKFSDYIVERLYLASKERELKKRKSMEDPFKPFWQQFTRKSSPSSSKPISPKSNNSNQQLGKNSDNIELTQRRQSLSK